MTTPQVWSALLVALTLSCCAKKSAPSEASVSAHKPAERELCPMFASAEEKTSKRPWFSAPGCRRSRSDGSEVLCWEHAVTGSTKTVSAVVYRAPGAERRRWRVYAGPSEWTPRLVRRDQAAEVCRWLSEGDTVTGQDIKPPVQLTHKHLTVMWGQRRWRSPLRSPPQLAPTAKLARREGLCCKATPADSWHFASSGLLALRLRYSCDWRKRPQGPEDVCADPAWTGSGPSVGFAGYFFPVGPLP